MKDNDLLVTELFRDPCGDAITALSVYLTPRTCTYWRVYVKLIFLFDVLFCKILQ